MKYKINITDKEDNPVYEGDVFKARMTPLDPGTLVTVVKDISDANKEIDRDFEVEDEKGQRLWNAYMVIKNGIAISKAS